MGHSLYSEPTLFAGQSQPPSGQTRRRDPSAVALAHLLTHDYPTYPLHDQWTESRRYVGLPFLAIQATIRALKGATAQWMRPRRRKPGVVRKAMPSPGSQASDEKWVPWEDHPFARLLERPGGRGSRNTFKTLVSQIVLQHQLFGRALVWGNRGKGTDKPVQLIVLPTVLCQQVPRSETYPGGAWRVMPAYTATGMGAVLPYGVTAGAVIDARDVYQFQMDHPVYRWSPYSILQGMRTPGDLLEFFDRAAWSQLTNAARPSGVVAVEGADTEHLQGIIDEFQRRHGGPENLGRLLGLGTPPGSSKPPQFTPWPNAEPEFYEQGHKRYADQMVAAFGQSAGLIGLGEVGGYAALYADIKKNRLLFLQPYADDIADFLTLGPGADWDDRGRVQIDLPKIDDPDLLNKKIDQCAVHSLGSTDEVRAMLGMGPVEHGELPPKVREALLMRQVQPQGQQGGPGGQPDGAPGGQPGADAGADNPLAAAMAGQGGGQDAGQPGDQSGDPTQDLVAREAMRLLGAGGEDGEDEESADGAVAKGFTGDITDKRGHRRYYVDGKQVAGGGKRPVDPEKKRQAWAGFEADARSALKRDLADMPAADAPARPAAGPAPPAAPGSSPGKPGAPAPGPGWQDHGGRRVKLSAARYGDYTGRTADGREYVGGRLVEEERPAGGGSSLGDRARGAWERVKAAFGRGGAGRAAAARVAEHAAATPAAREALSRVEQWADAQAARHAPAVAKNLGVSPDHAQKLLAAAIRALVREAGKPGVRSVTGSIRGKDAAGNTVVAQRLTVRRKPAAGGPAPRSGAPSLPRPANPAGAGSLPGGQPRAKAFGPHDALTAADPAPFGYCPECREPGVYAERDGDAVTCAGGHEYGRDEAKYASTQIDLTGEARRRVRALQARIDPDDLADDGIEEDVHITCCFGLHCRSAVPVAEAVRDFGPVRMRLGGVNAFRGGAYDVLYVAVDSPDLHRLHDRLCELPHTKTHDRYTPHATICYLKPGTADKYLAALPPADSSFVARTLVFSDAGHGKTRVRLAPRWGVAKGAGGDLGGYLDGLVAKACGPGSGAMSTLVGSSAGFLVRPGGVKGKRKGRRRRPRLAGYLKGLVGEAVGKAFAPVKPPAPGGR